MKKTVFIGVLLLCAAGVIPQQESELLHSAEEAIIGGDFEAAILIYDQLQPTTNDPGLLAFNKAVVKYRLSEYRDAEILWRRALADDAISADRRVKSLFNLGNALSKQSAGQQSQLLQEAIDCYDLVLSESSDEGIKKDAAYNLELAKLRLAKLKQAKTSNEKKDDWENPKPESKKEPSKNRPEEKNPQKSAKTKSKDVSKQKIEPTKEKPNPAEAKKETAQQIPGAGNLPVLNDDPGKEPLRGEDATAILNQTAQRLFKERQKLRQDSSQGERFRPNDW